jgi:hypothetical protein
MIRFFTLPKALAFGILKIDGDRLQLITPSIMSPNLGKMRRATATWLRAK